MMASSGAAAQAGRGARGGARRRRRTRRAEGPRWAVWAWLVVGGLLPWRPGGAQMAEPVAEPMTAANWIWYPERPSVEGRGQTRYFRASVELPGPPRAAWVRVLADDTVVVTINGQPAPEPVERGRGWVRYDLADRLTAGPNVVACAVTNAGGPGGLLVRGEITRADGEMRSLVSGATWRVSREAPEGWERPGFDDTGWPAAAVLGSVFLGPWWGHESYDPAPFATADELAAYAAWRATLLALPAGLEREPPTTARLGIEAGHAVLRLNGEAEPALIYRGTVDPLSTHGRRQIGLFRDAGVHVYAGYWPLAQCWKAPDVVDFTALDEYLRGYLSADPEARLFLILRLNAPVWWLAQHPDELTAYATGPVDSPNEAGRVQRASFASVAWREDMGQMWRQAIAHLEAQPWGKRVIAYHPGNGIYTEWHYWGSWTQSAPDTGPAMTAHFRDWLRQRYGNDAGLQAAWADTTARLATAAVPGVAPRQVAGSLGLRDPAAQRAVMDYYRCQQELTGDLLAEFGRQAKMATGGRALTGAFYGYFYGVLPQTQGGHLELDRLLADHALDYYAAPYDYSHRLMGDDGRLRVLPQAFGRSGAVQMIEADTRTSLHPVEEHGRLPDLASSVAAIRREVGTALTTPAALWWCDFGPELTGGWYDDPTLIAEIAALRRLAASRLGTPAQSVAQVAVLADPPSLYLLADGEALRTHEHLVDTVTSELYRTGTPFDTFLVSQLEGVDLTQYRMLIVLDALMPEAAARARLRAAAAGRTVLWLGAPGWSDGVRSGPEQVADLTGFTVAAPAGGLAVAAVEGATDEPLLARLPARTRRALTVSRTVPLPEALAADNYYNPRTAEVMEKQYRDYDWSVDDGTLRWRIACQVNWSDLHLRAAVAAADGLALSVAGEGGAVGLSLRLVAKDAVGDEFVTPRMTLTATLETHAWPLSGLARAPWSRSAKAAAELPLTGFKLVLDGGVGGLDGTLVVRDLSAAFGTVTATTARGWEDPAGAFRSLVIDDPAARPLVRAAGTDAVVAATRGEAGARQVLVTTPFVPHELLAALLDDAGVVRYVDSPAVIVRADSGLIVLHTAQAGRYTLRLPRAANVSDALTGAQLGTGDRFEVELAGPETRLLLLTP